MTANIMKMGKIEKKKSRVETQPEIVPHNVVNISADNLNITNLSLGQGADAFKKLSTGVISKKHV
mgnify:CR=1 FL=1